MISWSALLVLLPLVSALPTERRSVSGSLCGQFSTYSLGSYSLLTNLWGQNGANSNSQQCSQVDSADGSTVAWHTSYNWAGDNQIKSFSNLQLNTGINNPLSKISSMHTTWAWEQENKSDVVSDTVYDLFTSDTPNGSNLHEVMIWLYTCNAGPISYNYGEDGEGIPIESDLSIGGYTWNLYRGNNGSNEVFSFLPVDKATSINTFSSDLRAFFSYLITKGYIAQSEYLITAQAGTEATSGEATFTTSSYSLTIA